MIESGDFFNFVWVIAAQRAELIKVLRLNRIRRQLVGPTDGIGSSRADIDSRISPLAW